MAETVFQRIHRIVTGRVEDRVDQLEISGGPSVMREAIREVDRAIDEIRGQRESAMAARLQAARQQKLVETRIAELGEKARFAVDEGRDDLAEAALSRQVDFEGEIARLKAAQTGSENEEAKLDDSITALKTRKQQMTEALQAYEQSQREAAVGGDGSMTVQRELDKKVERAEAAFDRAMTGAGGVAFTRADADTINRVAEIDGLRKGSAVADRLAALKAGKAASGGAGDAAGKAA